jgi:hypothetical protein
MSATFQVGIDWGTHSSKICIVDPKGEYLTGPLFSSALLHHGDDLVFAPKGKIKEDELVRSLKSDLIQHSLSVPFWSRDDRPDSGTSLGEAVAFSLICLLSESRRWLAKDYGEVDFGQVEVGFSLPNWLAEDTRRATIAAGHFCEAVEVAIHIAASQKATDLPAPGKPFSISRLKQWIADARAAIGKDHDKHPTIEAVNKTAFSLTPEGPKWRFIVESGAAGLPYLRAMKLSNRPGVAGLAKLLVIDVGAGSTDVGYMLKTSNVTTGAPTLYYFHPASTFAEAGNALTEELVKYHRAQNKPLTWAEAELEKIADTSWHKLPFAQLWIRHICDHVAQYIHGVPDERWLPMPVKLHMVVTGGSGLVPGLRKQLHDAVIATLARRKFDFKTDENLSVDAVDKYKPTFNLETEAEVARRAVSFGAADPDKPGFRYMLKMDAPARPMKMGGRRWV